MFEFDGLEDVEYFERYDGKKSLNCWTYGPSTARKKGDGFTSLGRHQPWKPE